MVLKEGSRSTTLWWLSGSQGNRWHHGEVTVGRIPAQFTILFKASRTFNKPGHMAIDDIDFTNCTLPGTLPALSELSPFFKFYFFNELNISYPEPQPLCPESMFMCNNSVCVDHNQVCDFSDDCGDWSDESNCGEIYKRQ